MTTDDVAPRIHPALLEWAQVDPALHPFDAAGASAVVRSVVPAVPSPDPSAPSDHGERAIWNAHAHRWREATSRALVDHYGSWAAGWCWGRGESDHDGGVVTGWCCVRHSITTPGETLSRIADSLVEWRAWLEDLGDRFARHLPLTPPDDPIDAWEVAVAEVVTTTVAHTDADSSWYGHARQVLGWFLTAAGVPTERHPALVEHAVGGRFASWVAPSAAEVVDVARRLAVGMSGEQTTGRPVRVSGPVGTGSETVMLSATAARSPDDDLTAWRAVRELVDWDGSAEHVSGPVRGHRDAIVEHCVRRGEGSAALLDALATIRRAATRRGPLSFNRLARWQRTALAIRANPFRTGPAWAKGGREHYGWQPDLPELFERCLAEATDDDVPLPSRAARVYLDVSFFHPFDDGNARAATLALYYVLARDEVVLDRAAPLLMTVRQARDAAGAGGLARFVATLIESTRTRGAPP